jgi:hypothetical protein
VDLYYFILFTLSGRGPLRKQESCPTFIVADDVTVRDVRWNDVSKTRAGYSYCAVAGSPECGAATRATNETARDARRRKSLLISGIIAIGFHCEHRKLSPRALVLL